jgi:hypothetical protein
MQATVTKRMTHHLLLNAFYTFSKNLNSVQLDNNQTQGGAQNMLILAEDKGRADIDQRHAVSVSAVWQPEFSYVGNAAVKAVLNGWSISPIVRYHSGVPFTVLNGVDANLDGAGGDRANVVGDPLSGACPNGANVRTPSCWFNIAAFARNPAVTGSPVDGNSARNLLDQPGFKTVDLAIFRDFRFFEKYALEFRVEGTNTFNMVNLSPPGATAPASLASPGTFGTISSAGSMRQLQLGLRFTF